MNKTFRAASLIGAVLVAGAPAFAQQALKPGLWQIETRMPTDPEFEASMAELREQLAAMTPAERKQMEAVMGKNGVQLAAGGKGGTATRICMNREQAERKEVAGAQGDCTVTNTSRNGSTVTTRFTCSNPRSTGESVVKFTSAEAYSSKLTMITDSGGRKEKTVIDSDARWLSADCGSLKPIAPKTK